MGVDAQDGVLAAPTAVKPAMPIATTLPISALHDREYRQSYNFGTNYPTGERTTFQTHWKCQPLMTHRMSASLTSSSARTLEAAASGSNTTAPKQAGE